MSAGPVSESPFWKHLGESGLMSSTQIASIKKEWSIQVLQRGEASSTTHQLNDSSTSPIILENRDESHTESDSDFNNSDLAAAQNLVHRRFLTQFQAERLLEGRSRGFFFDQYKVLDLLGVGGMGWVYQAEDTRTGKHVALKVLLDQFKHDRGMLARFQQEARATLKLDHPNIVKTISLGSAGGSYYMIMEFVEGPSLLEVLLRCGKLKHPAACEFIRQAALGLQYAHEHGLVHRDVKPQNLLIDRNGNVKLLDFGLSMIEEGEKGDEFSMAMVFGHDCVGTAAYMAPEQAENSLHVDSRSDIYSLGCTLYAALIGDTPFSERSVTDLQIAHRTKRPPNVHLLSTSIPKEVAEVVAKMLAKNPADRYATAAEVAIALAPWSKPASKFSFDFESILNERKQVAREKLLEYLKSRPKSSGVQSSTTRPKTISSVVSIKNLARTSSVTGSTANPPRETHGSRSVPSSYLDDLKNPKAFGARTTSEIEVSGAVLVQIGGESFHPLNQKRILIGRSDGCTIKLLDASISGKHCELNFDGKRWWITDLGSRNGTRINGTTIKHRPLNSRDIITIGNKFKYRFDSGDLDLNLIKQRRRKRILFTAITLAGIIVVVFLWMSGALNSVPN